MSRPGGFSHADVDVNLLSDPKLRAVRKRMGPDPEGSYVAVLSYMAVVLECWRQGERLTLMQSLPEWIDYSEKVAEALIAEGLLDRQQRIPVRVWTDWYGVAEARREQRRSAGAAGGRAAAERRYSDASSDAVPDTHSSQTVRQTNRTDRHNNQSPTTRAPARERSNGSDRPSSIRDVLPPPPGYPDATG